MGKFASETIKVKSKSKAHLKDEELFYKYASTKDEKIRNTLVRNNQALVTYIVNKYYSNRKDYRKYREDILQEGTLGLMSAIDRYKVELGFKFSTYATCWIRQAVNNYLINIEPLIRVPSHIRTQHNKIIRKLKEENKTFQSLIATGTKAIEINGEKVSKKMMRSVQSAIQSKYVASIDKPINSKNNDGFAGTLKDVIPGSSPSLDTIFDSAIMIGIVKSGIGILSDRERNILLLRFDIIGENEITKNENNK